MFLAKKWRDRMIFLLVSLSLGIGIVGFINFDRAVIAEVRQTDERISAMENSGEMMNVKNPRKVIGSALRANINNPHLHLWIEQLSGLELAPEEVFSLSEWNTATTKLLKLKDNDVWISQLGSLLFEASIQAGLDFAERHIHDSFPNEAIEGFDLDFSQDEKGLKLYNPHDFVVHLHAYIADSSQMVVEWRADAHVNVQPRTIIVNKESYLKPAVTVLDQKLDAGVVVERAQTGREGLQFTVSVKSDKQLDEIVLYRDYYAVIPDLLLMGPQPVEDIFVPLDQPRIEEASVNENETHWQEHVQQYGIESQLESEVEVYSGVQTQDRQPDGTVENPFVLSGVTEEF